MIISIYENLEQWLILNLNDNVSRWMRPMFVLENGK